ncbi:MAG: nuclear transport factor 2 family protein [Pseudomonadota bacterium]
MAFSGPLEDRLAIRELVDTYSDAVARRDADAWAATWTDDAVWDLAGMKVEGKEAIVQMWLGAMGTFEFVAFHATPGAIEVDGETATARVYVSEVLVPKDGGLRRVEGAYDDQFRKEGGAWRFSHRGYNILHDDTQAD